MFINCWSTCGVCTQY